MTTNGPSEDEFDYAWRRIVLAKHLLRDNKDRLSRFTNSDEIDEERAKGISVELYMEPIILDSQLSIELSVKSIFKLTSISFPTFHSIEFDEKLTRNLINALPDEFKYKHLVPRAIFLTQLWERFYQISKYGLEELNLDSRDVIHNRDAERAIQDAESSVSLAEYYLDFIIEEHDFDDPRSSQNVDFELKTDFYSLGSDS